MGDDSIGPPVDSCFQNHFITSHRMSACLRELNGIRGADGGFISSSCSSAQGKPVHALLLSAIPYLENLLSHILVCAVPNPGHVGPMLAAAQHLKAVGHHVTFNSSSNFRDKVESAGIRFVPMTGKANYDYRRSSDSPDCKNSSDAEQKVHLLRTAFADTIPDQHQGIQQILQETPTDLVLVDTMLLGSFPMLLGPRRKRPPVIGCGVNPMMLSSQDCGIFASPATTPEGRQQILQENQTIQTTYRPVHDLINSIIRGYGLPTMPRFFLDCMYLLPDIFLQFTAEALSLRAATCPRRYALSVPSCRAGRSSFKSLAGGASWMAPGRWCWLLRARWQIMTSMK